MRNTSIPECQGRACSGGLLGVVVRFEDLHEAVQGFVGPGTFGAQDNDVAE